jgi:hypothetical protein
VGISWTPNLINAGPFAHARHRPALSWRLDCPVCGANFLAGDDCDHDASVVADVPAEEVEEAVLELLAVSTGLR